MKQPVWQTPHDLFLYTANTLVISICNKSVSFIASEEEAEMNAWYLTDYLSQYYLLTAPS